MGKRITKRSVDALKPGQVIWDVAPRGFGVRCQKASRVFFLKTRIAGEQVWLTIGPFGSPWTVEKARTRAEALLGDIADGKDPMVERDERKADLTIAELCDLYFAEGCATKKPSTLATDKGRIERHIKPLLGRKRVRAVTRGDVERLMRDVAAGKTAADVKTVPRGRAIVKGGKGTATKAVSLLGAIFTFATNRGMCQDNPAHGIVAYKPRKHERFLSPADHARLGDALREAEREGVNPSAIAAIRLLTMTGCRKSEILTLRWKDVVFERACFTLRDSKTGRKIVPLGAPVLDLLSKLPKYKNNPFVLPGEKAGHHFVGLPKVWQRIREKAKLKDVRLHDLRHSFASVGVASGDSLYMIGKLLGHSQTATSQCYAHLSDDPLKATADRIAGTIAAAMKGDTKGAEIISLPK